MGYAIEYAGSTIAALSMEARMTLCNMTIEAGSRIGMVAPDDTTFAYVKGRPLAPTGAAWDQALASWRGLATDPHAVFDKEVTLDVSALAPHVSWGTTPEESAPSICGFLIRPRKWIRVGARECSAASTIWT